MSDRNTIDRLQEQVVSAESDYLKTIKDVEKAIQRRDLAAVKFNTLREALERINPATTRRNSREGR